jgi:hypothetical protein
LLGGVERLLQPVENRFGRINAAFMQAVRAAEKVARYRHAQLSAIKLAGDIDAKNYDNATLDELLVKIKAELTKLGPILDLEAVREPRGVENRARLVQVRTTRRSFRDLSRRAVPCQPVLRLRRPLARFLRGIRQL